MEVSCDCVEYAVICYVRNSEAGEVGEAREAGTQRVRQVLAAGDLCILTQAKPESLTEVERLQSKSLNYCKQSMNTKEQMICSHLLNIDQGQNEFVVKVLNQVSF